MAVNRRKVLPLLMMVLILAFAVFGMCLFGVTGNNAYALDGVDGNAERVTHLSGEGTESNPFIISDIEGLAEIGEADTTVEKYYKLADNATIDFTDVEAWSPFEFNGFLDGNKGSGASIKNFKAGSSEENAHLGLFSVLGGSVENLKFSGTVTLVGNSEYIGTLAGYSDDIGKISGVEVENIIITSTHENAKIGGIIGYCGRGTIENCSVRNMTVKASGNGVVVGGIAGTFIGDINVIFDYENSSMTADRSHILDECNVTKLEFQGKKTEVVYEDLAAIVGGIIGINEGAFVERIESDTELIIDGNCRAVGGLIGENVLNVTGYADMLWSRLPEDDPKRGKVREKDYYQYNLKVSCCIFNGKIIVKSGAKVFAAGGVIGVENSIPIFDREIELASVVTETVSYCSFVGQLSTGIGSSVKYFGGITGINHSNILGCYAKGSFDANVEFMGGIVGKNDKSNNKSAELALVSNCYFYGQVTAINAGGIAGENYGKIDSALFIGETTENNSVPTFGINAELAAGGITAIAGDGSQTKYTLTFSNIVGEYVGAVFGQLSAGHTHCCYCYFNVEAFCEENVEAAEGSPGIVGLTGKDIVLGEIVGDWGHNSGALPYLSRFCTFSTSSDVISDGLIESQRNAIEDKFTSDCTEAQYAEITGSIVLKVEGEVLCDPDKYEQGVTGTVYNNLYYALSPDEGSVSGYVNTFVVYRDGYTLYKWRDEQANEYNAKQPVKAGTLSAPRIYDAVWELVDIVYKGFDTGIINFTGNRIEKRFDNEYSPVNMYFEHDLEIEYEWYYAKEFKDDDTEWVKLSSDLYPNGNNFNFKSVADTGYYFCRAVVYATGLYHGAEFKTMDGDVITVIITKALYEKIPEDIMRAIGAQYGEGSGKNLTIDQNTQIFMIDGGNYTGKKLSDEYYSLPMTTDVFWWENPDTTVSVNQESYGAYFNNNKTDYLDYNFNVTIITAKADYDGIKHDPIKGEVYCGKSLRGYNDKLAPYFSWKDESEYPTVNKKMYSAIYNTDSVNYNDFELEIELDLAQGRYSGITHEPITVRYSVDGTLSDCVLKTKAYWWQDEDIKLSVNHEPYMAWYCADKENYEWFELEIEVTVKPAESIVKPLYNGKSVFTDDVYDTDQLPELSLDSGSTDGTIVWENDTAELGVNEYYWSFTPADNVNILGKRGKLTLSKVIELIPEALNVTVSGDGIYTAYESFRADDVAVTVKYNNPKKINTLTSKDYQLEYKDGRDYFLIGDTEVIIKYSERGVELKESVSVTVNKIVVDEPIDDNEYIYSGETIVFGITENEIYTVEGGSGVNAMTYTATLTLKDGDNYCWKATEGTVTTVTWTIAKKKIAKPEIKGKYVYTAELQVCEVSPNVDYDVFNYRQTNADKYSVTASLKDKNNTCWTDETVEDVVCDWVIEKAEIDTPNVAEREYYFIGVSQELKYTAQKGMIVTGDRQIDAKTYDVIFRLENENYKWKDGYEQAQRIFKWTIYPMQVPAPNPAETEFTYNGKEITLPVAPHANVLAKNNVFTAAGEYEAEYTLSSGTNYEWANGFEEKTVNIKWKIAELKVKIPVMGETMPTFTDWLVKAPIAESEIDAVIGKKLYELSGNEAKFVGSDYEAVATLVDTDNTCWEDGSKTAKKFQWSISVLRIPLPTVGDPIRYTGREIKAPIDVVDRLDNCIEGNIATDAGDYEATVTLPDEVNYIWADDTVAPKIIPWSISRLPVKRPTVLRNCVYSSNVQYAAISESEYYTLSKNTATDVGKYEAVVSLKNKNYIWDNGKTDDLVLAWQITPLALQLPTKENDLAYTGFAQTVNINVSTACVITGNTETAPGTYTATVSLPNNNYVWSDGKTSAINIEWSIYTLALDVGDGADLQEYVIGTPLPTPTKDNYSFAGWYLTPDFSGAKITELSEIDANTTLYAKWVELSAVGGGSVNPDNRGTGGLSVQAIIGIAVACAGAAFALIIIIGVSVKKKRR